MSGFEFPSTPPLPPGAILPPPPPPPPAPVGWPAQPPVPSEPLTAVAWRPWGAIGVVALMMLFNVVGTLPAALLADTVTSAERQMMLFVGLIGYCAATLAVVYLVARRRGVSLAAAVGLRKAPWGEVVILAFVWSVAARIIAAAYALITARFGVEPRIEFDPTKLFSDSPLGITVVVLFAVVLAPFVEEVVFRGIVFPAFGRRFGLAWGVAVSSALFGVMHFQGYNTVPFIGLGAVFALLFSRTRTLWTAVLCHAFFNGASIALLYTLKGTGQL